MRGPWEKVYNFRPFSIDALGLVTLLGSEEVNAALGRLVPSRYLEYFPYLGAFVVAGDRFKEKKPSFRLYNITQGITTPDLTCWFTRWMLAQRFEMNRHIVRFEISDRPRRFWHWKLLAAVLAFLPMSFLLAMSVLSGDWYGLANVVAMTIAVLVRAYVMEANRNAIDHAVSEAQIASEGKPTEEKKCILVMSDSTTVTVLLPGNLILPIFIPNPEPQSEWLYHSARWIGWLAFGVHVVSIGQSRLATQIYTVVMLVLATVLMYWKLGCDDSKWYKKWKRLIGQELSAEQQEYECWFGSRLKATVFRWPTNFDFTTKEQYGIIPDEDKNNPKPPKRTVWLMKDGIKRPPAKRQDLYAWLKLSEDEEISMGKWDLFPHERNNNQDWWRVYHEKKALTQDLPDPLEPPKSKFSDPESKDSSSDNGAILTPTKSGRRKRRRPDTVLTAGGFIRHTGSDFGRSNTRQPTRTASDTLVLGSVGAASPIGLGANSSKMRTTESSFELT